MGDSRRVSSIEAGAVKVVNGRAGLGPGSDVKLSGGLTFDGKAPKPFALAADLVAERARRHGLDVGLDADLREPLLHVLRRIDRGLARGPAVLRVETVGQDDDDALGVGGQRRRIERRALCHRVPTPH